MTQPKHARLKAAMARATEFLRAPAARDGQRVVARLKAEYYLERAKVMAIAAGDDELAFRISDVRAEAEARWTDSVFASEIAAFTAESATV